MQFREYSTKYNNAYGFHIHILESQRGPDTLSVFKKLFIAVFLNHMDPRVSDGLENRDYGHRDSSRCQRVTLYPQQLTLNSSPSGGRSVDIVRSRTQAMEFSFNFS
jgi:hypothetical protein